MENLNLTENQLLELANDQTQNLYMMGEMENYLVFLWQSLAALDPQWRKTLADDHAELVAMMADSGAA